jgi:hypothetical protein
LKELHPEGQAGEELKASTGWLSNLKNESALFLEDKPHVNHYQRMQMIFVVNSFKKFIILLKKGIQVKNIINMDQVAQIFRN